MSCSRKAFQTARRTSERTLLTPWGASSIQKRICRLMDESPNSFSKQFGAGSVKTRGMSIVASLQIRIASGISVEYETPTSALIRTTRSVNDQLMTLLVMKSSLGIRISLRQSTKTKGIELLGNFFLGKINFYLVPSYIVLNGVIGIPIRI